MSEKNTTLGSIIQENDDIIYTPDRFTCAENLKRIFFPNVDTTVSDILLNIVDKQSGMMLSEMGIIPQPIEAYKKHVENNPNSNIRS